MFLSGKIWQPYPSLFESTGGPCPAFSSVFGGRSFGAKPVRAGQAIAVAALNIFCDPENISCP